MRSLFVGDLGDGPRSGVRSEGFLPTTSGRGEPATDVAVGDVQDFGDVALRQVLSRQIQCPHPSPLPPVMRLRIGGPHDSF